MTGSRPRADANGWYNHALTVGFQGSDATSGVDSCTTPSAYSGPDNQIASVPGSCRDQAANTSATRRSRSSTTRRRRSWRARSWEPDSNGWYNHALTVGFGGSDATSGLDSLHAARATRARTTLPPR